MKNRVYLTAYILSSFLVSSCASQKGKMFIPNSFIGVYNSKSMPQYSITFTRDSFIFKDLNNSSIEGYSISSCCDTITIGIWEALNNELIVLYTPQLNDNYITLNVKELSNSDNDSICFIINSPASINSLKYNSTFNEFYYLINAQCNGEIISHIGSISNRICIPKSNCQISEFSLAVRPSGEFEGREIGARILRGLDYRIQNQSSNIFEIYLPELTMEYMTYRRLNKDYIRIINKNMIEWDGVIYEK